MTRGAPWWLGGGTLKHKMYQRQVNYRGLCFVFEQLRRDAIMHGIVAILEKCILTQVPPAFRASSKAFHALQNACIPKRIAASACSALAQGLNPTTADELFCQAYTEPKAKASHLAFPSSLLYLYETRRQRIASRVPKLVTLVTDHTSVTAYKIHEDMHNWPGPT